MIDEQIPADLVVLGVHEPDPTITTGECYVETKSLDGETSLKQKSALAQTGGSLTCDADIAKLSGRIDSEFPNINLGSFTGVARTEGVSGNRRPQITASDKEIAGWFRGQPMTHNENSEWFRGQPMTRDEIENPGWFKGRPQITAGDKDIAGWFRGQPSALASGGTEAVPKGSIVLRGSSLKLTEYIWGVVIFTGHETKVMKNAATPQIKQSSIDREINRLLIYIVLFLWAICASAGIAGAIWSEHSDSSMWYLGVYFDEESALGFGDYALRALISAGTYWVLLASFVSISLIVSMVAVRSLQVKNPCWCCTLPRCCMCCCCLYYCYFLASWTMCLLAVVIKAHLLTFFVTTAPC